ncbi:hypothetical protein C8R44DRAFT_895254 [Mycena epipterygia]|nr:hypothetical protein C8R44DRAFT_895254 [Mycena epipterygia]
MPPSQPFFWSAILHLHESMQCAPVTLNAHSSAYPRPPRSPAPPRCDRHRPSCFREQPSPAQRLRNNRSKVVSWALPPRTYTIVCHNPVDVQPPVPHNELHRRALSTGGQNQDDANEFGIQSSAQQCHTRLLQVPTAWSSPSPRIKVHLRQKPQLWERYLAPPVEEREGCRCLSLPQFFPHRFRFPAWYLRPYPPSTSVYLLVLNALNARNARLLAQSEYPIGQFYARRGPFLAPAPCFLREYAGQRASAFLSSDVAPMDNALDRHTWGWGAEAAYVVNARLAELDVGLAEGVFRRSRWRGLVFLDAVKRPRLVQDVLVARVLARGAPRVEAWSYICKIHPARQNHIEHVRAP